MTAAQREAYLGGVAGAGLPVLSVVCTCLGLSDFNDAVRDYHLERACAVVDLAASFRPRGTCCSCRASTCSSGACSRRRTSGSASSTRARRVGSRAAERGLEVAIELLPFEFAFVRSLDDMERLLDEVGLPNVKAAIDVSHLWRSGSSRPRSTGSRAASRRSTSPTATAKATVTSRPDAGRRRSRTTWRSCTSWSYRGSASVELEFPRDGQPVEEWVAEALAATRTLLADGGQRPDLVRRHPRAAPARAASTAAINGVQLEAAAESGRVEVVAVASRTAERARAYAEAHGIERAHGTYEALLADPAVDAVYVSLPNALHAEWAVRALRPGSTCSARSRSTPTRPRSSGRSTPPTLRGSCSRRRSSSATTRRPTSSCGSSAAARSASCG